MKTIEDITYELLEKYFTTKIIYTGKMSPTDLKELFDYVKMLRGQQKNIQSDDIDFGLTD